MIDNVNEEKLRNEHALHLKYQNIFKQWSELLRLDNELKLLKSQNDENESNKMDTIGISPSLIPQSSLFPRFFKKFFFILIKLYLMV